MSRRPQRLHSFTDHYKNLLESIDSSDEDFMPNNTKSKNKLKKEETTVVKRKRTSEIDHDKLPASILQVRSSSSIKSDFYTMNTVDSVSFSDEFMLEESDFLSGSDLTDFDENQNPDKGLRKTKDKTQQGGPFLETYEAHSDQSDDLVRILDSSSSEEEKITNKSLFGIHVNNTSPHPSTHQLEKDISPHFLTPTPKNPPLLAKNGSPQPIPSNAELIKAYSEAKSCSELNSNDLGLKLESESSSLKKPRLFVPTRPFKGKLQPEISPTGHPQKMHSKLKLPGTGLSYSSKLPSLHPKKTQ